MSQIANQVHSKFKVFAGDLQPDKTIGGLAETVAAFATENKISAKSIGVEYLESAKRLIITLGYRDDEEAYPIKLHSVSLGKVDAAGDDFSALEQAMAQASANLSNVICHELYVTDEQDFLMIFMTHDSK
jgi:hypothetical protein